MTPEERELIEGVFERLRSVGPIDKDAQAEAFINSSVRQIRDSAYLLVQTIVVQNQALEQSEARMQELEQMVEQLQQSQPQQKPASGGSFLGGLFGGGKAEPQPQQSSSPWGGSVPAVGRQSPGYSGPSQGGSPWGNSAPPQAGYGQQPMQAPQAAGGGFMRSAMTTAAGVAGGVLAAGAIGNLLRGGQAEAAGHHQGGAQPAYQDPNSNDQGGTYSTQPQYQNASDNDQGSTGSDAEEDAATDAEVESEGGWGGGDDVET